MNEKHRKHDLIDFFRETTQNIESEYQRIYRSSSKDPGTAGDQGELNWKKVIEQWIPPYFHIETKGRILFEDGSISPQVDIIVLSPEYPQKLWDKKFYLSGGVVAVFECKNTLQRKHIKSLFENSRKIQQLTHNARGTIRSNLNSDIYFGLLAHSHSWKGKKSEPQKRITEAIYQFDNEIIKHPIEMPNAICVADLAFWKSTKGILPFEFEVNEDSINKILIHTEYMLYDGRQESDKDFYSPIGTMIFNLLYHLAWKYNGVRDIVSYMNNMQLQGCGEGKIRYWNKEELSWWTLERIKEQKHLKHEQWSEWSTMYF